ncbi:hypothetical protein Plec18167_005283 [Paecilomyces lecythidis]|uniref:Rhomboid family membrane protein n=1 Tax=Paecilomyces lecythidis TaxID=3004212 RepID=A0ABR3XKG7_9EURO
MSTATPTEPSPSGDNSPSQNAIREADYIRFKNYAAMTFLVASPVLIAIPPRKLDHLTVLLTGAFLVSANHLTREHTGRSITERLEERISRVKAPTTAITDPLPSERAHEIQAKLRAAREAQLKSGGLVSEELERLKRQQQQEKSAAERIWMGDESPGWKERRLEEERKALEEGKGYGDLIMEHIWDVWNWGKRSSGQDASASSDEKK